MCGIAGVMAVPCAQPLAAVLQKLADALAHRGPDGRGRYLAGNVGMVHTRLAVVDLETGDQPLYAQPEDDTSGEAWVALVANAEIYNDLEVRERLGPKRFVTRSDCESPLHLYLRHGETFADHLRGMYAIAIHDPRLGKGEPGRLILARDPFGIKPLYYAETNAGLAFASEPQALIAAGIVDPLLRPEAGDELLQLQFTTGRPTPFAGIERVLPGETIVIEEGAIVARRRRPALPGGSPRALPEETALRELRTVLADSVRLHQRSDVPYGLFLSGGVDSSVVLAMMARLNDRPVLAFTAAFPGAAVHDEREQARVVAGAAGARHVEVEVGEGDFWTLMPRIAACMDDPCADYAVLPSFKLAAAAREAGIKVVLTGEGGDELFAGYGRYRRALRPRLLGGRPMRFRGIFDGLGVLRDGGRWRLGIAAAEDEAKRPGRTPLQVAQAVDCADWLPNDLLAKLDRCLMAHGVEGRVPLIDPAVATFAFLLPDDHKIGGGIGKRLLRRLVERELAAARPFARKRGFTVPVQAWIASRAATLGPLVAGEPGVDNACRPGAARRLFQAAAGGNRRLGQAAWTLLFYALWHRRHVLGKPPGPDIEATLADPA